MRGVASQEVGRLKMATLLKTAKKNSSVETIMLEILFIETGPCEASQPILSNLALISN